MTALRINPETVTPKLHLLSEIIARLFHDQGGHTRILDQLAGEKDGDVGRFASRLILLLRLIELQRSLERLQARPAV